MSLRRQTLVVGSLTLLGLVGCGNDPTLDGAPTITLAPASITAVPGDTVRVQVSSTGGTVSGLLLGSSSDAAHVEQNGLVTAVAPGMAVLTASFDFQGQRVTGTIPVTVLGITLDPAQSVIAVGGTVGLRPTWVGDFARYGGFQWSSNDPTVATVDQFGVVRGVRPGVARITATAAANPRVKGEALVTVAVGGGAVQALVVLPNAVQLQAGSTQQLTASVTLTPGTPAGTTREALFTSSDTAIATVSPTGLVTAKAGGVATVTVAAAAAPSVTQVVTVTVVARGPAIGISDITAGDPPAPVDPSAVRGTVTVLAYANLDVMPGPVRLELRLAGRSVGVQQIPARAPNSPDFQRTATFAVNTAARDSAGKALYPNGAQTLELRAEWGCANATTPCTPQTGAVVRAVTLVNP